MPANRYNKPMSAMPVTDAQMLVRDAIARVNAVLPPGQAIGTDDSAVLLGPGATLDSLSVTSIFFEIETAAQAAGYTVDMFSAPFLLTPDTDTCVADITAWLTAQMARQRAAENAA